jgi:hypothetical protein
MAKKRSIEAESLINLLDEYRFDNPNVKITIPLFGIYVRSKGYDVQDYTIRRSAEFRAYLDKISKGTEEDSRSDLVTYKTLDADDFLEKNRTPDSLKSALVARDRYYARIAANAVEAINARQALERKVAEQKKRIAELETQLENVQAKADNADIRQKNAVIAKLKAILDSYIYPEAANAILGREVLLDTVNTVIPEELIKQKSIDADTDIKPFGYDSVNKLLGGFDD